jgi:hypothetical protein
MLFTNLTPVLTARNPGRFATFALAASIAALVVSAPASAQTQNQTQAPAQTPAQTTPPQQPQQQPSSSNAQSAPGTAPIATPGAAVALAPGHGPSYNNRWDLYGGLLFMNGQAGQNLPTRFNMGGGEAQYSYWLTNKFSIAADYRFGAGTTPVAPNSTFNNRLLVMQHIFAGGVQYRGPKNRYVAINYHAFAGGNYGIFDHSINAYPVQPPPVGTCPAQPGTQGGNVGLYCNHVAPWGALGGSIDFNQGAKLAVRLSPDITFEHFGTETREFFGISLGVLYRGHRQ